MTFKIYFEDGPAQGLYHRTPSPVASINIHAHYDEDEWPGIYKDTDVVEQGHHNFKWVPDDTE